MFHVIIEKRDPINGKTEKERLTFEHSHQIDVDEIEKTHSKSGYFSVDALVINVFEI